MWTIINAADVTPYVKHDNFQLDIGISDKLPQCTIDVEDSTSALSFAFGQTVMLWDEYVTPDHTLSGRAIQTYPTLNLVIDPSFINSGTSYTSGGVNSALISYSQFNANITFSNSSIGLANDANVTQNLTPVGYVVPGQQYMFSAYVTGKSTPTNIVAYLQINWLNAASGVISSVTTTPIAPPTTQAHWNISGTAPVGTVYAQLQFGAYATNATNSGVANFQTLQLEPMWFSGRPMGNGFPVTYPTPDCNFYQVTTIIMPDGTFARMGRIFLGYIAHIETTYDGLRRTWKLDCKSNGDLIENGGTNTPINGTFTNVTDLAIINSLISTYYSGVLTTGQRNTSSPTTTLVAGPIIDSVQYTDQTLREVLNNLSSSSGYVYWVDAYSYVWYVPVPYNYAAFSLLSSTTSQPDNVNTFAPIDYTYIQDGTQVRNSVKVTGGTFLVTVQDTFSGDGATKQFNLTRVGTNVTYISENGGTSTYAPTKANKVGIAGQQVNGTSGVVALMAANGTNVTFNTAPASGTDNVVINYTINQPVTILVEENNSIGQYGRRFVAVVSDGDLSSNAAAKVRGEAELAQWAYPVQNITFKLANHFSSNVYTTGFIQPGTTIYLTSTLDGLYNQPFTIQTCKVTSEGAGVNIYEYEAGVYRPSMRDIHRNVQKALKRTLAPAGSASIQLTYEVIRDNITYSENISTLAGTSSGVYLWGVGTYGYSTVS